MNLPKPRAIPVTYSYNNDTKDTVAMVSGVTYTANAMYEQFAVNTKILAGITQINTNFNTLLKFLIGKKQRDNEQSEEDNLERRPDNPMVRPSDTNKSAIDELMDTIATIATSAVVLISASLITALEDTKKKVTKNVLAFTLAITAFSRDLAADAIKIVTSAGDAIRAIPERFMKAVRYLYLSVEQGVDFLKRMGDLKWVESIKEIFSKITTPIKNFANFLNKMGLAEDMASLAKGLERVLKPIRAVVAFVTSVGVNFAKGIAVLTESGVIKILAGLAPIFEKLLVKLLWPIQLVLSLVDFIDGFMKGYAQEGFLEGVKQGLENAFDGFFGGIVNLAKDVISWVLDKLGAKKTAENFQKSVDDVWGGIKDTFSSILGIFKGIFTLDWTLIKKSAIEAGEGITNFFVDTIKGIFGVFTGLFEDLTGVDLEAKITGVVEWFKTEFVQIVKDLYQSIIDGLLGAARTVVESTVGNSVATKIFGARQASEEEINARAADVAEDRRTKEIGFNKWIGNWIGLRDDYTANQVTKEDLAEAKRQLAEEGLKVEEPKIKPADTIGVQMGKEVNTLKTEQDKKPEATTFLNNTNNITNGGNNSSRVAPVVNIQSTERASYSSPLNRYGQMKR